MQINMLALENIFFGFRFDSDNYKTTGARGVKVYLDVEHKHRLSQQLQAWDDWKCCQIENAQGLYAKSVSQK